MILGYIAGALGLIILLPVVMVVQFGIFAADGIIAIVISMLFFAVMWALTSVRGIFHDKRKSEANL